MKFDNKTCKVKDVNQNKRDSKYVNMCILIILKFVYEHFVTIINISLDPFMLIKKKVLSQPKKSGLEFGDIL